MKIVGFGQLHNELSNKNLENWFRCMGFCDYIYIYDQASDDGSLEYYKKHDNVITIESPVNNFERTTTCKSLLLNKLLSEHPDTDWIFWIDGDTILDGRMLRNNAKEVYTLLGEASKHMIDGIVMGHYNLWRSDIHYRVDSEYDWFHKNGRKVFWRNNGLLRFVDNGAPGAAGIHQPQFPQGLRKQVRIDRDLIHRGFATDEQIFNKYNLYKAEGQSGRDLERLLDEENLAVEQIGGDILPDWYEVSDTTAPTLKRRLKDL